MVFRPLEVRALLRLFSRGLFQHAVFVLSHIHTIDVYIKVIGLENAQSKI